MCGITGIIGKSLKEHKTDRIRTMMASINHRGPDEWGLYSSTRAVFGHMRLSIIDLAHGAQPMTTGRSVLVYNGEIYNYLELKAELEGQGIAFETTSDTEVVQKAIDFWGREAFARFNGQFALLYWDKGKKELIVARDRYAIRPLYYMNHEGDWHFASEMKAFDVIPGFRKQWKTDDLYMHGLTWNTWGDNTVFGNVKSLPGGTAAVFTVDGLRDQYQWYDIGLEEVNTPDNFEEACFSLKSQLRDSVNLRLRSDVPVGCYLSGGIDSSVTSYLAEEIKRERFKSFSVSFSDKEFDESEFQDDMVKHLGSEHHGVRVTSDMINENFAEAVRHFERPVFRTAPVPLFLLSKKVKEENIKVVLTGEAADEILCGYDVFKEIRILKAWESGTVDDVQITAWLKDLYPHLSHYSNADSLGFMKMYYEGFLGRLDTPAAGLIIRMSNNQVLKNYFNPDRKPSLSVDEAAESLADYLPGHIRDWPLLKRNQYMEMKSLLAGYLLSSQGDRMAMAHSIEGRFPFLDHRVVEWSFALNEQFKLNGMNQKYILKEAFRENIPPSILNRPKRPYMSPDLKSFLSEDGLKGIAADFLSEEKIGAYGLFNPRQVHRFLHKFRKRGLDTAGYRDNMIVTFLLSAQLAEYWIRHPRKEELDESLCRVKIIED